MSYLIETGSKSLGELSWAAKRFEKLYKDTKGFQDRKADPRVVKKALESQFNAVFAMMAALSDTFKSQGAEEYAKRISQAADNLARK